MSIELKQAAQMSLEALEEIALAGMSGTGQESEEGMRDWHARQAWKFIGIAARALDPLRTAIQQAESEPLTDTFVQTVPDKCNRILWRGRYLHLPIPNYPRQEVKEFGERVNEAMCNASIRQSMAGLGGCKELRIEDFEADLHPYILAYLDGNFDSVAITYAAMRTKELELT